MARGNEEEGRMDVRGVGEGSTTVQVVRGRTTGPEA